MPRSPRLPRLPRTARLAHLLWILPLAVLSSCTAFDSRWEATRPPMSAVEAQPLTGKWEGTWQSDSSDYHGHLQAIIVATGKVTVDNVERQGYAVDLKQRLFEVASNEYNFKLTATPMADGRVHFEGKKDLGYYQGGIVRYDGYVYMDKDEFYCDYISDKDSGTFKMRRITLENQ